MRGASVKREPKKKKRITHDLLLYVVIVYSVGACELECECEAQQKVFVIDQE